MVNEVAEITLDGNSIITVLLGGGLLAAVVGLLKVGRERRNIDANTDEARAQAANIVSGAAVALLKPLRESVADLETKLRQCQDQVDALTSELRAAHREIEASAEREVALQREAVLLREQLAALRAAEDAYTESGRQGRPKKEGK